MKLKSSGLIDLHFHGAFGIDLMTARAVELEKLSQKLGKAGISAFCPTTLSDTPDHLLRAVIELGAFIRAKRDPKHAQPVGIHLEGPFLAQSARGAHSEKVIRKATLDELDALWAQSQETLKIITLAPETLSPEALKKVTLWCERRKIILSLGHSKCTQKQAENAFNLGFKGVTHAWNAMPFHHREPGILGAALKNKNVYLEIIPDQIHLSRETIELTRKAHSGPVCFVSDCAPAAGLKEGVRTRFGNLIIEYREGASYIKSSDALAGGGQILIDSLTNLLNDLIDDGRIKSRADLKAFVDCATLNPARALGLSQKILKNGPKLEWSIIPA